jgi:hypothetical protein
MSEQVKPVHRQVIEIGQQAFFHPDDTYTGQLCWKSRSDWSPTLIIDNTKWQQDERGRRRLASAAYITRVDGLDTELFVDGDAAKDYLNDPYGLDFLEKFQTYFADPHNLAVRGLVLATTGDLRVIEDGFTSTGVEVDIFQIAKV